MLSYLYAVLSMFSHCGVETVTVMLRKLASCLRLTNARFLQRAEDFLLFTRGQVNYTRAGSFEALQFLAWFGLLSSLSTLALRAVSAQSAHC
jgi:hypothetical protein